MMSDSEDEIILIRAATFVVNELLDTPLLLRDPELWDLCEESKRSSNFTDIVIPKYSLEEFRSNFHLSRTCFSNLMKKVGNTKRILNLEQKLLFTVWMLSKQESFSSVGSRFNFSKGAAHTTFCEILDALLLLTEEYVKWPSRRQYDEIAQAFKEKSGGYISGIVGAIDACHIQMKQPVRNPIDYCNKQNKHSIIIQGVCDHRMLFIDIYVGVPGKLHNARVLRKSALFEQLDSLVPGEYHIVGDVTYPLLKTLMVPFKDNGNLSEQQLHFNTSLNNARVTIERAFGSLKGRFQRLKSLHVSNPMKANKIVGASVILHNHIILNNDDTDFFEQHDSEDFPLPVASNHQSKSGVIKRNYFLSFL